MTVCCCAYCPAIQWVAVATLFFSVATFGTDAYCKVAPGHAEPLLFLQSQLLHSLLPNAHLIDRAPTRHRSLGGRG